MARPWEETQMGQLNSDPPAKRRKTEDGFTTKQSGYNSAEDDGDALFEDIGDLPPQHFTQPTQIIRRPSDTPPTPRLGEVQVPASSPFRSPANLPTPPTKRPQQSGLASFIAPAGTSFRNPNIARSAQKARDVIDLSDDDGPAYNGSSDDESSKNANIKPSAFYPRTSKGSSDTTDPLHRPVAPGKAKFQNILNNSIHKPRTAPSKKDPVGTLYDPRKSNSMRPTIDLTTIEIPDAPLPRGIPDPMASAYGGRPKQPSVQRRPERPKAVSDLSLDDITDWTMREKIERVQSVFPWATVLMCRDTLLATKGNFDDASNLLMAKEPVNLSSDDELPDLPDIKKATITTKRGVVNVQSIKDRYGGAATALPAKKAAVPTSSQATEEEVKPKPKKRLMQGRKNVSSPVKAPSPKPVSKQAEPINLDSDTEGGYDSGVASQSEVDVDLDGRVLKLFNKCQAVELADLAGVTKEVAEKFLESRPFRSLAAARKVADTSKTKSGKASKRAPMGDKIVESATNMMKGYEAVDKLVNACNAIGGPLKTEMSRWGFDVFGSSKSGELELTSMNEDEESLRDSGIGTPSSATASQNGDHGEEDVRTMNRKDRSVKFLQKPANMSETTVLKDYQIVGLNWLALLYKQGLSGAILADEMGLGKTCQVIAFLSYLATIDTPGPHLIIVPGSTLENWLREFGHFSPGLVVLPYHGPQHEREQLAKNILDRRDKINVVVTTYDMAFKANDNKFMRRLNPNVCVYDEGHLLKNPKAQRYQALVKIPFQFRLLLTGTPLQNNLQELAALLAFILPKVFEENRDELDFIFKHKAKTTDSDHSALLSTQRMNRAKHILAPFNLRRKKTQVLKHLPAKVCRIEYCELHPSQQEIYNGHKEQAIERARLRVEGAKIPKTDENNPLMQLRKAAIHPQLFRRHFTDKKIEKMAGILQKSYLAEFSPDGPKGPGTGYKTEYLLQEMKSLSDFVLHKWCINYPLIGKFDVEDASWYDSGKVKAMIKLVEQYKANGDRVLIFSQFSMMLDILEEVLNGSGIYFSRIDGSTKIDERQTIIDQFRDDETITAFLLTTKAGGTGLNLMMANKVIIFDASFNPQDDVQAENRAHRVGQQRDVEVVRLVTKNTIEEQILRLGQSKLALDRGVAGDESNVDEEGEADVARMLLEADKNGTIATKEDEPVKGKGKERQGSGSTAAARKSVSGTTGGRKQSKQSMILSQM